jgi:Fe-S-cluster-containing hydrogenase component 2
MKGMVVYYSATGSTKKIAQAIQRGMQGVLEGCDIASIKKTNPGKMDQYDLIAVGAPIWYFRAPANLMLFIHNMPQLEGKLGFAFCSHGSAPVGFMRAVVPALKRKGLTVIGWKDWYGSVNQVIYMPKPYFTDGHPDVIDLQEAEQFGREMAERARRIQEGETDLIPEIPRGRDDFLFRVVQMGAPPGVRDEGTTERAGQVSQPKRKIDIEKCTYPQCTACMDNCPTTTIDFSASPPVFKNNCLECNLCQRICPLEAVEYTHGRQVSKKIIHMDKCTFPECTLCLDHCPMNAIDFSVNPPVFKKNCEGDELCWVICPQDAIEIVNLKKNFNGFVVDRNHAYLKFLEEAEAKGKFRRLTSLDEVGWDTPIWKMKKIPRYVIEED